MGASWSWEECNYGNGICKGECNYGNGEYVRECNYGNGEYVRGNVIMVMGNM